MMPHSLSVRLIRERIKWERNRGRRHKGICGDFPHGSGVPPPSCDVRSVYGSLRVQTGDSRPRLVGLPVCSLNRGFRPRLILASTGHAYAHEPNWGSRVGLPICNLTSEILAP
jgi:hypothetical protein